MLEVTISHILFIGWLYSSNSESRKYSRHFIQSKKPRNKLCDLGSFDPDWVQTKMAVRLADVGSSESHSSVSLEPK